MSSDNVIGVPGYVAGAAIVLAVITPYLISKLRKPPAHGPLTARQIKLIKETWAKAEALGAETVGVLLFHHIFEAAPAAAGLFSSMKGFDPKGDLSKNPALVKHAVGVVSTVSTAVSLLNDLPTLVPVLNDLGGRHCKYSVKKEHYPIVGGALVKTLALGLGSAYTDEVNEAYLALWRVVEATMLAGYPH